MRLTSFGGYAGDILALSFKGFLDAVANGTGAFPPDNTYRLDQIQETRAYIESGQATGKLVVTT